MNDPQPPARHPTIDDMSGCAGAQQLKARDNAVLPGGEFGNDRVAPASATLAVAAGSAPRGIATRWGWRQRVLRRRAPRAAGAWLSVSVDAALAPGDSIPHDENE